MAIIYKTDKSFVNVEPKNGESFSLEELQSIVGGYIEIVNLDNGDIAVMNEEGKLMNLPFNPYATAAISNLNKRYANEFIVGDVLFCRSEEVK